MAGEGVGDVRGCGRLAVPSTKLGIISSQVYITQEGHNFETLFILKRESHIVAQVCLRISPPVSASRVVDLHVCTTTPRSATHSSSQRDDFEIIHFVEENKL